MNADDMKVGQRVQLIQTIYDEAPSPGQIMPKINAGTTGVVTALFPDADHEMGEPFAHVRLDVTIESLEEWNNTLHVWREDGDVLPGDFELA
jgi:hypothetical protein